MVKRLLVLAVLVMAGVSAAVGQVKFTDKVLVLPFENTSGKPEFNWVGESFALSLSELLHVPGLNVISNGERKMMQQRLRIPLASLPSLASARRRLSPSAASRAVTCRRIGVGTTLMQPPLLSASIKPGSARSGE